VRDRIVTPDDLTLFFLIHRAIRTDLAAFADAIATVDPADRTRIAQLSRWLGFVERAIHAHHEGEDEWLYPLVAGRDPGFAAARAGLEAEHRALDPALIDVRARLEALATIEDRAALAAAARGLAEHMRAHLDREEEVLVPAMTRWVTLRELGDFEREGSRKTSLRDLSLVLPWVASAATPAELATLRGVLPWPVRLLHRWSWQPSYDRLQRAFRAPAEVAR